MLALPWVAALAPAEVTMPVSFTDVTALPVAGTPERLRYGDAPSQFGELWLPEGTETQAPLIILIHGGCWLADYDVEHVRALASALRDEGYAVWAPEYRRVGEPGGGWPGTFDDVAAAVDHVRKLSPGEVDLDRVVIAGHSAGGHLALWAAARPAFAESSPFHDSKALEVAGVVGLAAITDLAAYAAGDNSCQQVTPRLMEGMPEEQPGRYSAASPAGLTPHAKTVLLHGLADSIVPPDQAKQLKHAHLVGIPYAGHFDLIHPGTAAFPPLLETLAMLLGR